MFTGIVSEVGQVVALTKRNEKERRLAIKTASAYFADAKLGDSIMVDGVCLTITTYNDHEATFDVMVTTMAVTRMQDYQVGEVVNLEQAIRAGDRFDGHFVLGHVDGTGTITTMSQTDETVYLTITPADQGLMHQIVTKGSIAVNGVSLTVVTASATAFVIALIPHTLTHTMLRTVQIGDVVNLETDVLAKYLTKE